MKRIFQNIVMYLGIFFLIILLSTSCEEYLDKAPEVNITEEQVFTNFNSFQGFVEDLYQCVVDVTLGTDAYSCYNWSDDVVNMLSTGLGVHFTSGNYWQWTAYRQSPFAGLMSSGNTQTAKGQKGYWHSGWWGIRNANIAIKHIQDLASGTQEQRDLLAGQAHFFRAYLHFEILRAWGGIPYIDSVYAPTDIIIPPRLSYLETANRISEDFKIAAQKLPANWDETEVGKATLEKNQSRVTKGAAYAYLGKNLLYAASPLMNGVETGSYTYNIDLCKQAAAAFYEVIKLVDQGYHGFETWADYFRNFYTLNYEMPLGKEILFNNPIYIYKRWNYMEHQLQNLGGWGCVSSPTVNYIENFGMANGLPITGSTADTLGCGYNPNDPWANRDPRFYYNIQVDGEQQILNQITQDTYAQFYTGGIHRNNSNCTTGFMHKKFKHVTCNPKDNKWGNGYFAECPQMRLADVYLMYAEAVNEAYDGPNGAHPGGPTALWAVNKIRERAGVPDVDPRFLDKDKFREIIRQERAVELAFENHRWYDLRRWHIAHEDKYRKKYALDLDKNHTYFIPYVFETIVFYDKHYWLPFPTAQVSLYAGWPQNPGW